MFAFFKRINLLLAISATLLCISATTPWFGARFRSSEWSVVPLSTGVLRPSAILLLTMAIIGVVVSAHSRIGHHLVGLAVTIWGTCCLWAWLIGGQLRHWLPGGVVPRGLIPNPRMGVLLGVVALAIIFVETFAPSWFLASKDWKWIAQQLIVLMTAIFIIVTRDLPWASFQVQSYQLEIGPQSIPIYGEIYGLNCLVLAVSLICASMGSQIAFKIVALVSSVLVLIMGFLAIVMRSGVDWIARRSLDLAGVENQQVETFEHLQGPQLISLAGAIGVIVSIYLLWNGQDRETLAYKKEPSETISNTFDGAKYI